MLSLPEMNTLESPGFSERIYLLLNAKEKEQIVNLLAIWYEALPNRVFYAIQDTLKEIATDGITKTRHYRAFKQDKDYSHLPHIIAPMVQKAIPEPEVLATIEKYLTIGREPDAGAKKQVIALKNTLIFKDHLEKLLKTTPKLTEALSGVSLLLKHPLASLIFSGIKTASEYLELKNRKQRILLEIWLIFRKKYIMNSIQTALHYMANETEKPFKNTGTIKNALRKITPGNKSREENASKTAAQLHFLADMLADMENLSGEIE